jgi:hypothetical protein
MPIQLIDNFELNVQKPIDNRFVVGVTYSLTYGGYSTRYDIVNPYEGLRIWDLNDSQPYVFNGTTWSSEASLTTIQGTGTANYVPLFNTSNSIVNSSIYETSGNILIGTTSVTSGKLQVNGAIRTSDGFIGNGATISNINASNISSGSLALARITVNGSSGFVMTRDSSTAQWQAPSDLSVGTASNAQNVVVSNTNSASTHYLLFSAVTSGSTQARLTSASPGGIAVKPSSSQILVPPYYQNPPAPQVPVFYAYGADAPPYSFIGDSDTGIYSPESNRVAVSVGGSNAMIFGPSFNTSSLQLQIPYGTEAAPGIVFSGDTNNGIYRVGNDEIGIVTGGSRNIGLRRGSGSQSVTFYSQTGASFSNFRVEGNNTYVSGNGITFSSPISIGNNGGALRRVTTGTIRIYQNGTTPLIIRGTGFTVAALTSGNVPVCSVTLTGSVGNDVIILASMDGSVSFYNYSVATEKINSSSFKISVACDSGSIPNSWTGNVLVSFICISI